MPAAIARRRFLSGAGSLLTAGLTTPFLAAPAFAQDAVEILRAAFGNWRAESSHAVLEMEIRRASGTRSMTLESWTEGEDKALVRFTAPARDAGNATLQLGTSTYVFNPRLNQVIKLPASAMSQSWMGSDFSYEDLSRSERVIDDYTHTLLETKRVGGMTTYVIESVPNRGVPVVWGKQVIEVRADGVLMSVAYYDQVGNRVRVMTADQVTEIGGRPYPVVMTMIADETPDEYTRVITRSAAFDIDIPSYLFTKSNLENPRN